MKPVFILLGLLLVCSATDNLQGYPLGSSVAKHGKLSVKNLQLVSSTGQAVQLRGMSTHGPQWFENCYTLASFTALANEWKVDVIRVAMYVTEGGYNTKPDYWKTKVSQYVKWAGQLGIYVIIDWHTLNPGNPNDNNYHLRQDFFESMSQQFATANHVLYEICNEPNGVQWNQVANYAHNVILMIRRHDAHSVIIVGTPNWSSDLGSVVPLSFPNLLYTFHFYAASHTNWDMLAQQAGRIPIIVTEFGTCEYSGTGNINTSNANKFLSVMNGANPSHQKISFINWSFSHKEESCSALKSGSCNSGQWNAVTPSGQWIKARTTEAH